MITENIGLVWSIVRRFLGRGYEADDLFQIGCIGLMKAIDKLRIRTNVPQFFSECTSSSSIKASIKANPIPERSISGLVVYIGSIAAIISAIPIPQSSVAGRRQVLKPEECYSGFKCAVKEEDGLGCEAGENCVCLQFAAHSKNESFARMVAAAYVAQLNPTLEELADIKTAVSEAVTNAVIHGYGDGDGVICMRFDIAGSEICIEVEDWGMGIADIHFKSAAHQGVTPL